MSLAKGVRLAGFGHYLPERRVSNAELEADLDLPPGWIEARTGIQTRHYAAPDQALSDLAVPAGRMALAGLADPPDIGLLLLATSTPDHLLPPTAPLVAHRIGLSCGAVDLAGACAGFLHALVLGAGHVHLTGQAVLVIGANILSRRIDPDERASRILFADAAGAVLLTPCDDSTLGPLACDLKSDGGGYDAIRIPRGGSRRPFDPTHADGLTMTMPDGPAVFAAAVTAMTSSAQSVLHSAGISAAQVTHWAPHQANQRIIAQVGKAVGLGHAQWLGTLHTHGNSSAATIPLALSCFHQDGGRLDGQTLLLSAFGAGMIWGSVLWQG